MYGKLFKSLYDGSMMGAGLNVHALWPYVIANKDEEGFLEINPKLVAFKLGGTIQDITSALEYLMAPDPESRSKHEGGRRLLQIEDHLYWVVNHKSYDEIRRIEDRKEQNRKAQAKLRAKKKLSAEMLTDNDSQQESSMSAHVDVTVSVPVDLAVPLEESDLPTNHGSARDNSSTEKQPPTGAKDKNESTGTPNASTTVGPPNADLDNGTPDTEGKKVPHFKFRVPGLKDAEEPWPYMEEHMNIVSEISPFFCKLPTGRGLQNLRNKVNSLNAKDRALLFKFMGSIAMAHSDEKYHSMEISLNWLIKDDGDFMSELAAKAFMHDERILPIRGENGQPTMFYWVTYIGPLPTKKNPVESFGEDWVTLGEGALSIDELKGIKDPLNLECHPIYPQ